MYGNCGGGCCVGGVGGITKSGGLTFRLKKPLIQVDALEHHLLGETSITEMLLGLLKKSFTFFPKTFNDNTMFRSLF